MESNKKEDQELSGSEKIKSIFKRQYLKEFQFKETKLEADKIEDISERILFLKKSLYEFEIKKNWLFDNHYRYEENVNALIKYLEDLKLLGKSNGLDLSNILLKIRFDKDGATKKRVEKILTELNEKKLLTESKDNEFTAVASILYKTGWVINISTFSGWLKLLSTECNRDNTPVYKENQVKDLAGKIKQKYSFLDTLPTK